MRDLYEIGCTPHNEECEQLGEGYNPIRAKAECRAYMAQLERVYGAPPAGCYLKITNNLHDFGTYHEVGVIYDDESDIHIDYIFGNLENGCENWDEEAKKELNL